MFFVRKVTERMLLLLVSNNKTEKGSNNTAENRLLLISAVLRILKQAFVYYCTSSHVADVNKNHGNKIPKFILTNGNEMTITCNQRKSWIVVETKMSLEGEGSCQQQQQQQTSSEIEPHRFRVNIDELNFRVKFIMVPKAATTEDGSKEEDSSSEIVMEIKDIVV